MAYITRSFYDEIFGTSDLPESDFSVLADVSSDLIAGLCCPAPRGCTLLKTQFKKAVAYQVRFLYEQGGVSAVLGQSDAALSGGSESLGDYSVSAGSESSGSQTAMLNGIPVCGYTLFLLEQLGLMTRLVRRARWPVGNC